MKIGGFWLHLAVEDPLSEGVSRRLFGEYRPDVEILQCYGRSGSGFLKKRIRSWNQAARQLPFLVLTDLDQAECAPSLIGEWLPTEPHPNLLLRVAVREVEAWLLADHQGWAEFLGLQQPPKFHRPEDLPDPKAALLKEAARSRRRSIRSDLLPAPGTTARVGPNYNGRLIDFVGTTWHPERARHHADSLDRMIRAIEAFRPRIPND